MRTKPWLTAVALFLAAAIPATAQETPADPQATLPPPTAAQPESGRPWIGVRLTPADEVLAGHLGATPGQAWLVDEVLADSPAAEAQIKRHDVLVSVNGEPLASIEELSRVLAEANGEPVTVDLFRKGQRQSVSLTPKPAPAESYVERAVATIGWLTPFRADLPEGVEIMVSKNGSEPAKVAIRRGRQTWVMLPDDSLERLPEDLREPIATFLGRATANRRWTNFYDDRLSTLYRNPLAVPYVGSAGRDESLRRLGVRPPERPQPPPSPQPALEQRLDDMARRLEALEKSIAEDTKKAE
jgi:membrane-associated protease RseP (regulator of RpoE activity)